MEVVLVEKSTSVAFLSFEMSDSEFLTDSMGHNYSCKEVTQFKRVEEIT